LTESTATAGPSPTSSAPPAWLTALATFTGNVYLLLGSFIFALLGILVAWIPPRGNASFYVFRLWANGLLAASGVRVESRFDVPLDPAKEYIFLANHQSLFDIPVLLATSPGQLRMMAKRTLFQVPFFGWSLKAGGFIAIDRADKSSARESFSAAVEKLRSGTSILLFPEGTRSMTDMLLPFQRGGFLLALRSGLPIVPVGVRGSRAVQRRGSFSIHPGTIAVHYGPPIETAEYGLKRKRELTALVRGQVAERAGLATGDVGTEEAAPERA
jgi:1-acyl-sn-glycerol-3-phosphate acyltransferase